MVDSDDKYAGDEENLTQVRNIIKQLNEEKPSTEKHREVVVRADGSKMVRVTRKRRVMMTAADHKRRNRKHLLLVISALFVLLAGLALVFFFRMTSMTGQAYVAASQSELQQRWGASSLQLEGAGIAGRTLRLESVIAEFPEGYMLERVELHGVEAQLNMMSFISAVPEGDELRVDRALVQLRPGASMQMPVQNGADMWRFRRMECKDFTVQFGAGGEAGPVALRSAQAYMYYPNAARSSSVIMFRNGSLAIKGWNTVRVTEGKARLAAGGITDFSFAGTTDAATDTVESRRTSISFAGKLPEAADFTGPFAMESDNMSLADFTGGRFEEFFTARTVAVTHGKIKDKMTIRLAGLGDAAPAFRGELHLKDICLSSFPALMEITEHIEPGKRRLYNPLSLHRGYVVLGGESDTLRLELPEGALMERDLINLRGCIELNGKNELSGSLEYGVPMALTRVEYPDGQPDPIFQQSGEWSWLRTRVKGLGNMPGDDMAEVEARADIARRERPARIPFNQIDIDRLTVQFEQGGAAIAPVPQPVEDTSRPVDRENPFGEKKSDLSNPFESRSENPFESTAPF